MGLITSAMSSTFGFDRLLMRFLAIVIDGRKRCFEQINQMIVVVAKRAKEAFLAKNFHFSVFS